MILDNWVIYWKSLRMITTIKNICNTDNSQHGSYINRGTCNRKKK